MAENDAPEIEYEYTKGKQGAVPIRVKLDGKIVGAIRPVLNGWRYFPKGGQGGETYPTITEVQRSLESD